MWPWRAGEVTDNTTGETHMYLVHVCLVLAAHLSSACPGPSTSDTDLVYPGVVAASVTLVICHSYSQLGLYNIRLP